MTWEFDTPSHPTAGTSVPELSSAPVFWLYLGIGAALVGLALPFATDSPQIAVVGWLMGGTVSILLLAAFIHQDTARRANGWALADDSAAVLRVLLLVSATAAVVANAWVIADAVARHQW